MRSGCYSHRLSERTARAQRWGERLQELAWAEGPVAGRQEAEEPGEEGRSRRAAGGRQRGRDACAGGREQERESAFAVAVAAAAGEAAAGAVDVVGAAAEGPS